MDIVFNYLKASLFFVLLFVVVSGGFLLILRPFVLWYYKIYTLVSELKENNALLREIRDELRLQNTPRIVPRRNDTEAAPSANHPQQSAADYSAYMPK